ncbi:hypothetical protein OBBRIDRAFT_791459 [Obba rivulosa]|uniref:Uncharacterized protein n=1 Tax=Obba rivulosa TaxID=1052685 RepID=A0A8E2B008_9APHY|nr:hypothetical protein OBBRIDRAFT_791459 [Obba rivulosa]
MPSSPSSSSESSRDSSSSLPPPLASSTRSSSTSLSLECPPSQSGSILRTSSSCTLPERGGVRFAPLPAIEPRRRKSSVQLGVAARSRMLRQRRMLREQGELLQAHPDAVGWGPEEDSLHPVDRRQELDEDPEMDEEEAEDPLVIRRRRRPDPTEEALASLGKLVKGAGKSLWRRVSSKKSHLRSAEQGGSGHGEHDKENDALSEKEQEGAPDAPECVDVAISVSEVSVEQSREEEENVQVSSRPRSGSRTKSSADAHPCKEEAATLQTRRAAAVQPQ